jgi:hypothetical protein
MKPRHSLLLLLTALTLSACASSPLRERFAALDGSEKAFFLRYYPIMTPNQRLAFAGHISDSERFIESWSENEEFKNKLVNYPGAKPGKKPFAPIRLEISPERSNLVTEGSSLSLKAWLHYPEQVKVDATQDVTWTVQPESLATMDDSTLKVGCMASEVTVGANFLDEREGSRAFQIRKPLSTLHLGIDDSWRGNHRENPLRKLSLTAECADGTRADVSCQGSWVIAGERSEELEIRGCGYLHLKSKEWPRDLIVQISAEYGGKSVSKAIQIH